MTEKILIATLVGALVAAVVALLFSGRKSSPLNDGRPKGRKLEGIAPSGGDAESVARLDARAPEDTPMASNNTLKRDPVAAVTIYLSLAAGVLFWAIVLWAILS